MGNSSSSPPASRRQSRSPRAEVEIPSKGRRNSRRYQAAAEVEIPAKSRRQSRVQVEAPAVERRVRVVSPARGRGRKQSGLPRDPTTGRYLPRGQRAASPSRGPARSQKAASRRRVEVDVVSVPRTTRRASPRRPQAEVEVEQEAPMRSRVAFADKPRRQELEPTARGSPILRSSYTRMDEAEVPMERPAPRSRSASPVRRQAAAAPTHQESPSRLPVSRREYASPSLAATSAVDQDQVVIGPSTVRRMRKMAADVDTIAEAPQPERMAQTAAPQSNLEQILFSYMNTP